MAYPLGPPLHAGVNDDLRAQEEEEHDIDMEEMLRHIELEVLLGSAKGLERFETLKKAANDRMYDGCGKEWTLAFCASTSNP